MTNYAAIPALWVSVTVLILIVIMAALSPQSFVDINAKTSIMVVATGAAILGWASCIAIERENMEAKRRA